MLLETVFMYRTLIGKCDLGCGLDLEDIEQVHDIEDRFTSRRGDGRRFKRHATKLKGIVRGDQINDRVAIVEMGPGGLICVGSPFITRGEQVEIAIDDGEECYRFCAKGVWLKEVGEEFRIGLQFLGMPVKLRKVQLREHTQDVIDNIADTDDIDLDDADAA
jgi:hypothetical protein